MRWITQIVLGLLAMLLVGGCANRVTPPMQPCDPVTVYLVDYGRHSSVLLPTQPGHVTEYAYGDWNWFASNSTSFTNAIQALFFSHSATIGRRTVLEGAGRRDLRERIVAERLQPILVSRKDADALAEALDQRFQRHRATMVYNPFAALYLVKDPEHYGLFHNCNHVTAQWLTTLGCKVSGPTMTSNFVVKQAAACAAGNAVDSPSR